MMPWFDFEARHRSPHVAEVIACEMAGKPPPIYRTSGKVKAWTFWGARRYIRRKFGSRLIEIVSVRKVAPR